MTETQKQDFGNAFHTGTQAINAIATGNYTPLLNNGVNMLTRPVMEKVLKNNNGTVVGYIMNELGNLGYVKGTQAKGPIETASFAGSLINAATTAVKSPMSFATSLVKNAVGSVAGIDIDSSTIANAKAAFNGITQMPGQVFNGIQNSANSLASSIGLGNVFSGDSSTPSAPAQSAGLSYNPVNYNNSGSGVGSSTGVAVQQNVATAANKASAAASSAASSSASSAASSSASSTTATASTIPSSPSYAYNSSAYSSTPYQTGASYSSGTIATKTENYKVNDSYTAYDSVAVYNADGKLKTDNSSLRVNQTYDPYSPATPAKYNQINTLINDEYAKCTENANESTGRRSLAAFLHHMNNFGAQLQNNFEVQFSGIDGLTLFVMNFEMPGSKQNTCEVYYDGIKITIPVNYEHDHEFSITMMNDAQGFIYSTIKSYIELDSYNHATDTGNTLLVRALTGDINCVWTGSRLFAKGVRLTGISGLTYGQSNNEIQTFTVQGTLIEYSHLPLWLSEHR